jgi:pimeloyl-ACP methyl ester carboxylesterase
MIELDMVRHDFADVNGLRLHRLDYGGSDRPIVCLHGVTGHAWTWHDVAAQLREAGRVVALDMRGHGDSQWAADAAYTTDDHASDLEGVIEAIGAEDVDLAGNSWGALVALAFAARNPGAVRRLAIVDVEPSFEQGETDLFPRPRSFPSHREAVEWERQSNPHAPDHMIEIMAAMGTRPGEGGQLLRKHDPFFLERWPFRSDDRWEELRGLKMPALVVHAKDSFVRGDVAERMAEEIPEGRVVHIADSGHLVPVEQPAELARVLREFFAE